MSKHQADEEKKQWLFAQRGEWVEALFGVSAMRKHIELFKPCSAWGPTDWLVAGKDFYHRVQVRGTEARTTRGNYRRSSICRSRHGLSVRFTRREVDFFAFYVIPEDDWYIIPAKIVLRLRDQISLSPTNKYQKYREAWHLLKQPPAPSTERAAIAAR